jgi:hypothetical protein
MFTVSGADGTTGNYVNEHGILHQTVTLRRINEHDVEYQGEAHIRDSWFPGYSWTIMVCAVCGHHLGWQFISVDTTTNVQERRTNPMMNDIEPRNVTVIDHVQRPNVFYGVSATNVKTFVPNPPLRRPICPLRRSARIDDDGIA